MYTAHLKIEDLPTNQTNSRGHWAIRHRETAKWDLLVHYAAHLKIPAKPLARARIACMRFGPRLLDADGLVTSFKHVIDALVSCGILENDAWKNIGMPVYGQRVVKPPYSIEIMIEEIPDTGQK